MQVSAPGLRLRPQRRGSQQLLSQRRRVQGDPMGLPVLRCHLTLSQDCQCQPPFPPGCDCDPGADDPSESCSAGTECVQCVCLPRGCDCDPSAEDPDTFCPAGEKCDERNTRKKYDEENGPKIMFRCDECQCRRPLPPGCECDQESDNPDELCPGDLR